jgi:hypothetical protein
MLQVGAVVGIAEEGEEQAVEAAAAAAAAAAVVGEEEEEEEEVGVAVGVGVKVDGLEFVGIFAREKTIAQECYLASTSNVATIQTWVPTSAKPGKLMTIANPLAISG